MNSGDSRPLRTSSSGEMRREGRTNSENGGGLAPQTSSELSYRSKSVLSRMPVSKPNRLFRHVSGSARTHEGSVMAYDREYLLTRAEEERRAALKATTPTAREFHLAMAAEYTKRAGQEVSQASGQLG